MEYSKNILFEKYLQMQGIHLGEDIASLKKKSISEELVKKQFQSISKFHYIAKNYHGHDLKNIDNKIGKLIERYKIEIRILKRNISELEKVNEFNKEGRSISDSFYKMLKISENCISKAMEADYLELIKRSMKNNEICLGNTYFNNISENEVLNIKSLNGICFNMVEFDGIYILNKIKDSGINFNWSSLIHEYALAEKLNQNSEEFIMALIFYPSEYMKWIRRYVKNSGEFSNDYYAMKLSKAINKYGENKGVNLC